MQREGKLSTFLTSMISLVIFVLAIAIVSCVLCYFGRANVGRKQCSFDANVYIDLTTKLEERVKLTDAATKNIQKNGFTIREKKN